MTESTSAQSAGGQARADKLSPEERSLIAKKAAAERWGTNIPRALYTGEIMIGQTLIACAVLDDETRLINQETFMVALGRAAKAKGGTGAASSLIPPFLAAKNLRPFISPELEEKPDLSAIQLLAAERRTVFAQTFWPMCVRSTLTPRQRGIS